MAVVGGVRQGAGGARTYAGADQFTRYHRSRGSGAGSGGERAAQGGDTRDTARPDYTNRRRKPHRRVKPGGGGNVRQTSSTGDGAADGGAHRPAIAAREAPTRHAALPDDR